MFVQNVIKHGTFQQQNVIKMVMPFLFVINVFAQDENILREEGPTKHSSGQPPYNTNLNRNDLGN